VSAAEDKARARAEGERFLAAFAAAGAVRIEADILLPAATLLDLYGEDIRARAFLTADPVAGERVLRPDFTVPVVERHMREGAEPARYCYLGEVFRRQDRAGPSRPAEYLQAGYELFDRGDPAAAEAEVFALVAGLLAPLGLRAATGDIGLLVAAVEGLDTTPARRAALRRHIWRPRRFRALLDRFAGRAPVPPARAALVAAVAEGRGEALIDAAGPAIGLRSRAEVAARMAALAEDAAAPPLPAAQADLLLALLDISAPAPAALAQLRELACELPALGPAADRLDRRLAALAARGVAVEGLAFEASYGRTSLEYYDGFVFGLYAEGRPDLPPVASGGRYDALTAALGAGRAIPAVGGVIRPGLALMLAEGRA
jgi:ATP phosphoribosyltransferase regulatory subunit